MFTEGTKVRCVDGRFQKSPRLEGMHLPEEGRVYTVRSVEDVQGEGIGLLFREIFNPPVRIIGAPDYGKEPWFRSERFIPLR